MNKIIVDRINELTVLNFQFIVIIIALFTVTSMAQNNEKSNKKALIGFNPTDTLRVDTTKTAEAAPLDIAQHRGLFIITPDQKMQMRIFGSVRYLVVYDNIEMRTKDYLNTYKIPTGTLNQPLPNYYNGLDQTRLGFDVTRKTDDGDVFVRLETDFVGVGFRIRHAYGQYRNWTLGQTWSLFTQITALPAVINFGGPTGATTLRTPQIRYAFQKPVFGMNLALGLEYIVPNLTIPDSLSLKSFQLFPTVTARLDKKFSWGYLQFSGIIPVLSGRTNPDELLVKTGWGLAASTIVNLDKGNRFYLNATGGKAITSFTNNLTGNGIDVIVDPDGKVILPLTVYGYCSFEHTWNEHVYSNITYGMINLEPVSFLSDETFRRSHALHFNTFWTAVEGAKVGAELIWAKRIDKDQTSGEAFRGNLLFYYDF